MKILHSLFPTPNYLSAPALGVDISDTSVKYMEIIFREHGDKIGKYGNINLPKGVIEGGKIINPQKLIDSLKFLKEKEGFKYVRATLPEEKIYQYEIDFVPENVVDLRQSIELTLEEHIPLPPASVEFDYEILEKTPGKIRVLVGAVDKNTANQYVDIFEKIGMTVVSLELEGAALTRALVKDEKESVMIVDFGSTRTGISVVFNGHTLFSTTISFGGQYLTELIAKDFNISIEEAELKKTKIGLSKSPENKELFGVILSGISVLRDEINKNYIYWHTHSSENGLSRPRIGKVILCGGNANLTGLKDYLTSSLKMPIELANPWRNLDKKDSYIPEISFEESLSYAPAVGLALAQKIK